MAEHRAIDPAKPLMSRGIRPFRPTDLDRCRQILAALPEWFGIPESNEGYLARLSPEVSAVFESDSAVLGFVSILRHNSASTEVDVIAVDPSQRGTGIGRKLMRWVEESATREGVRWLHVKTRGPSTPDPYYAQTRAFYARIEFDALFESMDLWGPDDAALILVKRLQSTDSRTATRGESAVEERISIRRCTFWRRATFSFGLGRVGDIRLRLLGSVPQGHSRGRAA